MRASIHSIRNLAVVLALAATLTASLLTTPFSGSQTTSNTAARDCVAHASSICRDTPFPIFRRPVA